MVNKKYYEYLLAWLLGGLVAFRANATLVDPSFDPGTGASGGLVETVVPLPDGKILACGNFTSFNNSNRSYVVRLNADGSVDPSFNAAPGYWVRHMAVQPDGKIVIGGFFNNVQGEDRHRIARLNADGSLDETFQVGTGAEDKITQVASDPLEPNIFQVAIQSDGKIVMVGNFATYNGVPRSGIARLNSDGSLDTSFNPGAGFNSWGRSIHLLDDGRMIATGWFTSYDNHPFNRMVILSSTGQPDLSFNPYFGDSTSIYDMIRLSDGKMIVAGHSINDQGLFRREVARINPDGSFDDSFVGTTNEKTESARIQPDGKIVMGGYFSQADGVSRNGIVRFNPDGTVDPDFSASFDNFIWTVAFDRDGKVLASGGFTSVDGISRGGIVRLNTGISTLPNTAPIVAITNPANNAILTAPATVTITASASDSDGSVAQVLFYNGLNLIGQSATAPYSASIANLAAGTYQITARAIDNGGAVTLSSPIQITVNASVNQAPSISIAAPPNNSTLSAPRDLVITVNASDSDGTITKVDFFNGRGYLGQSTTPPFTFTVQNALAGVYNLVARATDNSGAVTSSSGSHVTLTTTQSGNIAPTVILTSPQDNEVMTAPIDLVVSADANDADGSIAKVEFYSGETLLGERTAAPYTLTIPNVALGSYALTAKAVDNLGAETISSVAHIIIQTGSIPVPTLTVTSSGNGVLALSVPTALNHTYTLQRAETLYANSWQNITNFTGTGSNIEFVRPADQAAAFFRVRAE